MKRKSFLLLLMSLVCLIASAQKLSVHKGDMISRILSDTLNPDIYLIPITVRFGKDESVWLGYDHVLFLYEHFKKRNGWTMSQFEGQLRTNVLEGKPFEVANDSYFKQKKFLPFPECDCLYNESSDKLKSRVESDNFYKSPDTRFACFVYKCFKNNVVLAQMEMKIYYKIGWE